MSGVVLASLSAGAGELSFLGLTHYFGAFSLASWGSGTGGAGLIGAGAYVLATTTIGLSVRTSLLAFSFLPIVMLLSFFAILPKGPLKKNIQRKGSYQNIPELVEDDSSDEADNGSLLSQRLNDDRMSASTTYTRSDSHPWSQFKAKIMRARCLFFP